MSCSIVNLIDEDQCMGDSLDTINDNFTSINTFSCATSSTFAIIQTNLTNINTLIQPLTGANRETGDFVVQGALGVNGSNGPKWYAGSGIPEGSIFASKGSLYSDINGSSGNVLFVKETDETVSTGWVAK